MIINRCIHNSARIWTALPGLAMLALILAAGLTPPLAAQEAKKDDAKPAAAAPSAEGFKVGVYDGHAEFEVGYRALDRMSGREDVYRSMVNLREGAQLFRSNISLRSPYGTGKLFDHFDLSMDNWGFDPYNNMRLNFGKSDKYEVRAEYRKMNYYNYLPTWANPLLAKGNTLSQHGLDVNYHTTDIQFKLFPSSRFRPFVAFSHQISDGPGFTTTSTVGNEFMLNSRWHYKADDIRGGVEMVFPRMAMTIEQGYRFIKNDSEATDALNSSQGNWTPPYLGQTITQTSLDRSYHDRTTLPVTRLAAKFSPIDSLRITGRYIYSMSDLDSSMSEIRTGNFITLQERLFYQSAADSITANAKRPNHNAAFTAEYSPFSRLTIIDQFDSRNNHVSGSALLSSTYFNVKPLSGEPQKQYDAKFSDLLASYLAFDQTRNQAEAQFDLGYSFMLRGGYRYTSTEAHLESTENNSTDSDSAKVTQHTGIFGMAFRPNRRIHLGADYEVNSTTGLLTRTDLVDYSQIKFHWEIEPMKSLSVSGHVGLITNGNRLPDIDLKAHNRSYSVAVNYELNERFSLNADYTYSDIFSDMSIILPQFLDPARSVFDERGSSTGGGVLIDFYKGLKGEGGLRAITNAGDFSFHYWQPYAGLTVPLSNGFALKTYFHEYNYHEKGSDLMSHRTRMFTVSLAYAR